LTNGAKVIQVFHVWSINVIMPTWKEFSYVRLHTK